MNPPNYRVRRATLDDLNELSALWKSMNLPVEELGKRITEFQVAESADGEFLGAVGFQLEGRQGRVHSEVFKDFALADQLRPLLWERIQAVARNHGVARLWTQESAPFWGQHGFQPDSADALKKLPASWNQSAADWRTLKLKDEEIIASMEKELAMYMQVEKQRTSKMFEHARTIKFIATMVAIALAVLLVVAMFYLFRRNPGLLAPH